MRTPEGPQTRHSDRTARREAEQVGEDVARLEFTVPGDIVAALSPNRTVCLHWAEKGRRVETWKARTRLMWRQAGGLRFEQKVRIALTVRRARKVDEDNLVASCKALLDGLKDGPLVKYGPKAPGMVPDDGPDYVELVVKQEAGRAWAGPAAEVLVTVELIGDTDD